MIAGLGVDICTLQQVEELISSFGDGGLDAAVQPLSDVFTAAEIERAKTRTNTVEHLAGVFAAKEAVFKALSASWDEGGRMSEIEVWSADNGQPHVTVSGYFKELLGDGSILVTISHDGGVALAAAVVDR